MNPEAIVDSVLERHRGMPGALLPILHAIQDQFGYIPKAAVPPIARELHLSRAEVHGVITFYHHFREEPQGRMIVRVCRAEACQAVGANELVAHAQKRLGCSLHATTSDGAVTLEPVYCLGQCSVGPSMMIGEQVYARVTPQRFDALVCEGRVELS